MRIFALFGSKTISISLFEHLPSKKSRCFGWKKFGWLCAYSSSCMEILIFDFLPAKV
jgi:hypothetical protein